MPNWKVVKNTTLFAEEVIPRLRGRAARSDGAGTSSATSAMSATEVVA